MGDTAGNVDLENSVQVMDPSGETAMVTNDENMNTSVDNEQVDAHAQDAEEVKKNKMPRIDIKKLTKFMSQRKLRTFKAKQKSEKKAAKMGQKKKKTIKW